jgi:hypothetical protein
MANRLENLIAEIIALPESDRRYVAGVLSSGTATNQIRDGEPAHRGYESQGLRGMKSVLVKLPDDLANDAQAAGLLGDKPIEDLIRRALRERVSDSSVSNERTGASSFRLPVYRGKSGLAKGIDPSSNRSMLDAAGDDT